MKTADPIEKLAREYFSRRDSECRTERDLDQRVLTTAVAALEQPETGLKRGGAWGNPSFRWAAVPSTAVVLVIAALLVAHLTTPAWAIEQTIQALRAVKGLYMSGWCVQPGQPKRDFEIWARPSAQDPAVSGDFGLREGDVHLAIASERENATYVLERRPPARGGTVVYVTQGLNRRTLLQTDTWFEKLKKEAKDWKVQLRTDPQTGRRIAVVTCEGLPLNTARFWEFQFDVETKLPIRARVWFTADRQGDPHWDITRFTYNPVLPADAFTFKIPADAQVVDCRALRSVVSADVGLPVGDADPHQACRLAVEAYWHAVIGQDWERARRLRPFPDDSAWEELKTLYRESQPVELPKIQFTEHVSDPGALAEVGSLIKLSNGRTVQSILNVEIARSDDGTRQAMIVGSLGPEFIGAP